jgi:short-subunit dehydrogenase
MRKQDSGLIINISSIGGLIGLPYQSMYSASKFAIEGLTESLYKELRSSNIKIVLVEPGDFKTSFTEKREIPKNAKENCYIKLLISQIRDCAIRLALSIKNLQLY